MTSYKKTGRTIGMLLSASFGIIAISLIAVLVAVIYGRAKVNSISYVKRNVPTMFEVQASMVERAGSRWDPELLPKKEQKKISKKSAKLARNIEERIRKEAARMKTDCTFDLVDGDAMVRNASRCKSCHEHIYNHTCVSSAHQHFVAESIFRLFKDKGYDVEYNYKTNCCQDEYIRMHVSWGQGLRKASVEKVQ